MSSDTPNPSDRDDGGERSGSSEPRTGALPGPELDRLPPPAFPPGSRRSSAPRRRPTPDEEAASEGGAAEIPDDAFISPDDPIRKEGRGIPDDAFISPDDPLEPAERDEEGTVTGMGEFLKNPGGGTPGDQEKPTIHELPYLLDHLAEKINESGEKALRIHPEMGHFQAALRSFLRGYLEGTGG